MTTTSTSVTISGGVTALPFLPQPNTTQTIVNGYVSPCATGTTVYTVTAGKTFYMTGWTVTTWAAAATYTFTIQNGAARNFCSLQMDTDGGGQGIFSSATPIFAFPAGATVIIAHNTAGNNVACGVWGYEV